MKSKLIKATMLLVLFSIILITASAAVTSSSVRIAPSPRLSVDMSYENSSLKVDFKNEGNTAIQYNYKINLINSKDQKYFFNSGELYSAFYEDNKYLDLSMYSKDLKEDSYLVDLVVEYKWAEKDSKEWIGEDFLSKKLEIYYSKSGELLSIELGDQRLVDGKIVQEVTIKNNSTDTQSVDIENKLSSKVMATTQLAPLQSKKMSLNLDNQDAVLKASAKDIYSSSVVVNIPSEYKESNKRTIPTSGFASLAASSDDSDSSGLFSIMLLMSPLLFFAVMAVVFFMFRDLKKLTNQQQDILERFTKINQERNEMVLDYEARIHRIEKEIKRHNDF